MTREQLERALDHGFLDRRLPGAAQFSPLLIDNQREYTMSRAITNELRLADEFVFSVAFVTPGALNVLKQDLLDFKGKGTIITSNYLGFNSPAAYREMLNIPGLDARVVPARHGFHAKGYVFRRDGLTTAIVGSSNLTVSALSSNHEWNLRFSANQQGHLIEQLENAIAGQLDIASAIDQRWIEQYECDYRPPVRSGWLDKPAAHLELDDAVEPEAVPAMGRRPARRKIVPNRMQTEAMQSLAGLREGGEESALVVSATGTGKTILAALDVQQFRPKRFLFLAHREQILDKAKQEFQRVLTDESASVFGKLAGSSRDIGSGIKFLFATTQSFVTAMEGGSFRQDEFDYILIDEVHRAGAPSYRKIIGHMMPRFLLGMTATPERTDGFNVFELFGYNLAYEIRLQQALEENMLAPFHYFGVTDFTTAAGESSTTYSDLRFLVSEERADHVVAKLQLYGQAGQAPRGLIFCGRNEEAAQLSRLLNERELHGKKLRTRAISGEDPVEFREASVRELERGELDYLLSVDIMNEGIDIPSLNQIVMLRQTESSIVFTQQLGRGLRKHPRKDYLVVIDFIGNYANNYLIPTALFSDSSGNKDRLRQRLIDADANHVISGISSINFDSIARERVFEAISSAKLDSRANLKQAYLALKARVGRVPLLLDFARQNTVDPETIGTKMGNYAMFVQWADKDALGEWVLPEPGNATLSMLTSELLNGKRPHELLLLQSLLSAGGPLTQAAFVQLLKVRGLTHDDATLESIRRILTLEWFSQQDRKKYGDDPLVTFDGVCFRLSTRWKELYSQEAHFRLFVDDVIETGLHLSLHRYDFASTMIVGERYSRKDYSRLKNWALNEQATINGYKLHRGTMTCPVFVTYRKQEDVSVNTQYKDRFVDPQTMLWYTRNPRRLQSPEVLNILSGEFDMHLLVKKDDAEGNDHLYVGPVRPSHERQAVMPDTEIPVVTMHLNLTEPIDGATFDYFESRT